MIVVLGSSYSIARTFARSLQWVVGGSAVAFSELCFCPDIGERFSSWVTSGDHVHPGSIIRAKFRNVSFERDLPIDELIVQASPLDASGFFKSLVRKSAELTALRFEAPLFRGAGRQLRCTIHRAGKLSVSTAEVAESEVIALLGELENFFVPTGGREST